MWGPHGVQAPAPRCTWTRRWSAAPQMPTASCPCSPTPGTPWPAPSASPPSTPWLAPGCCGYQVAPCGLQCHVERAWRCKVIAHGLQVWERVCRDLSKQSTCRATAKSCLLCHLSALESPGVPSEHSLERAQLARNHATFGREK